MTEGMDSLFRGNNRGESGRGVYFSSVIIAFAPSSVTPVKTGVYTNSLDSRFRGNDKGMDSRRVREVTGGTVFIYKTYRILILIMKTIVVILNKFTRGDIIQRNDF